MVHAAAFHRHSRVQRSGVHRRVTPRILAVDTESLGFQKEIIVIDDGSTDGTGEIARSFPGVRVLHPGLQPGKRQSGPARHTRIHRRLHPDSGRRSGIRPVRLPALADRPAARRRLRLRQPRSETTPETTGLYSLSRPPSRNKTSAPGSPANYLLSGPGCSTSDGSPTRLPPTNSTPRPS